LAGPCLIETNAIGFIIPKFTVTLINYHCSIVLCVGESAKEISEQVVE
jgi:hypothetical protein